MVLQTFFPNHVQVVFLLQPSGFFQRAFADFRSKFVKEELEFKVTAALLFFVWVNVGFTEKWYRQ